MRLQTNPRLYLYPYLSYMAASQSTLFCERGSLVSSHLAVCMNSATPSPRLPAITHSPPTGLVLGRESSLHTCYIWNVPRGADLYCTLQNKNVQDEPSCNVETSVSESTRRIILLLLLLFSTTYYHNDKSMEEEVRRGEKWWCNRLFFF